MDFRRIARQKLPAPIFHYLDGGADDEWTLRRNTTAFDEYELLPAQLSDVSKVDMQTTLFGETIDWPVMISPTGASKLFHAAGESAVIRAAEKFGMIYSLSTLGTMTIEDVCAAYSGPKMYQLYVFKDRGLTTDLIARCKAAGFKALCLTVDTPVAGNRERDHVYGFATGKFRLRSVPGLLRHPGWLYRVLAKKDLEMVNLASSVRPDQFEDTSFAGLLQQSAGSIPDVARRRMVVRKVGWAAGCQRRANGHRLQKLGRRRCDRRHVVQSWRAAAGRDAGAGRLHRRCCGCIAGPAGNHM